MDAGAEFAITQPVFDVDAARALPRVASSTCASRSSPASGRSCRVRNAEFLANEVPGVVVPDAVIARMRRASEKSKEHAVAEGIAIAREMLERVRGAVQGVQVSAPVRQGGAGARGVRELSAGGRQSRAYIRRLRRPSEESSVKGILIIDHGSVRDAANHDARVRGRAGAAHGRRCAWWCAWRTWSSPSPRSRDGFAACVAAGATEIVAFPYMLSPGKHSTRDIPRMVARGRRARIPRFRAVTPAFGVNEQLAAVVLERAGVTPRHARAVLRRWRARAACGAVPRRWMTVAHDVGAPRAEAR